MEIQVDFDPIYISFCSQQVQPIYQDAVTLSLPLPLDTEQAFIEHLLFA